jgi:hypothetical protein
MRDEVVAFRSALGGVRATNAALVACAGKEDNL